MADASVRQHGEAHKTILVIARQKIRNIVKFLKLP
jgi:hypothetical protein